MNEQEKKLNSASASARLAALREMLDGELGTPERGAGAGQGAGRAASGADDSGAGHGAGRAASGADESDARRAGDNVPDASAALPPLSREVNNHVHTTYSFSPYSPSAAAWHARKAGLSVVGSVDHDSIGAAGEMRSAAAMLGMGSTTGVEVRVDFSATPFGDRPLNNPDGGGIAYIVVHAVPADSRERFAAFLEPVRAARNERTGRMTDALSTMLTRLGCAPLDYARDVLGLSQFHDGGEVTERHMLYAAAQRVVEAAGTGSPLVQWLEDKLRIEVPGSSREQLGDPGNPYLLYDLLGVLKRELLPTVYERPGSVECVPVADVITLAHETGAMPAYSYLGDIESSVTGDKRPAQFEDAYLDDLIRWVRKAGFAAVTYMPPRNTRAQLERLAGLCREHELIEISGVDINSPRQTFHCPEVLEPAYEHLIDSAWALTVHERVAAFDPDAGLLARSGPVSRLSPRRRLGAFAKVAAGMDPHEEPDGETVARAVYEQCTRE